jgi:exonuclease SbcD
MRILHTSDWHLGATLYGKRRHDESSRFLSWLVETIRREQIDLLLIAGDIFDSSAPGSTTQRMYYEFLGTVSRTGCSSVIVIAGNHDSPSLLSAPRELLHSLNIHVIGSIEEDITRQVIPVTGPDGSCRLLVCAVPFLREKDIRAALPAECGSSPVPLLTRGIASHYQKIAESALEQRERLGPDIPIIATGHLFAAGCETRTGEGVRECYVGSSVLIGADTFPDCFSYVALGHLHIPQRVAGRDCIRYSGSPLPVGFSEAGQEKQVILIDIPDGETVITEERIVPRFQRLASLKGQKQDIEEELFRLVREGEKAWIEVFVESTESPSSLQNWITGITRNTGIEPLRICSPDSLRSCLQYGHDGESLEELSEREVFVRRLDEENLTEQERNDLTSAFEEILIDYHQADRMEEV